MKNKLSDVANAVIMSETISIENVQFIDISDMKCWGKVRRQNYALDGVHLTPQGTSVMSSLWVSGILDTKPELKRIVQPAQRRESSQHQGSREGPVQHQGAGPQVRGPRVDQGRGPRLGDRGGQQQHQRGYHRGPQGRSDHAGHAGHNQRYQNNQSRPREVIVVTGVGTNMVRGADKSLTL